MWVGVLQVVWPEALLQMLMLMPASLTSACRQVLTYGEEAPIADGWGKGLALLPFLAGSARGHL